MLTANPGFVIEFINSKNDSLDFCLDHFFAFSENGKDVYIFKSLY